MVLRLFRPVHFAWQRFLQYRRSRLELLHQGLLRFLLELILKVLPKKSQHWARVICQKPQILTSPYLPEVSGLRSRDLGVWDLGLGFPSAVSGVGLGSEIVTGHGMWMSHGTFCSCLQVILFAVDVPQPRCRAMFR